MKITANDQLKTGRFDTPVEDYSREVRLIKTLADVRAFETKFKLILDDAAPCFARINEETFPEFIEQFPRCFQNDALPDDDWLAKYSAIPLPELFIRIASSLSGACSGFVLHRLLDENLAEVIDGRLILLTEQL